MTRLLLDFGGDGRVSRLSRRETRLMQLTISVAISQI